MIEASSIRTLRGLCEDLSIGRTENLGARLEGLVSQDDWYELGVGLLLLNRHVILRRSIGDSGDYAAFRIYVSSIYPAVSEISGWSLEEFQFRAETVMNIDSAPPRRFERESEDFRESQMMVAAGLMCFVGLDAWSEASWQEVVDFLGEVGNV